MGGIQRKLAPGHHLHSFYMKLIWAPSLTRGAERENEVPRGPYLHGFDRKLIFDATA